MTPRFTFLQEEIVRILKKNNARYSNPLTSDDLADYVKATPSYIRRTIIKLKKNKIVGVRRGSGGGFFLLRDSVM